MADVINCDGGLGPGESVESVEIGSKPSRGGKFVERILKFQHQTRREELLVILAGKPPRFDTGAIPVMQLRSKIGGFQIKEGSRRHPAGKRLRGIGNLTDSPNTGPDP